MKKMYTLLFISAISIGAMCQEKWAWISNEAPVMEKGDPDTFEDQSVGFPCVLQVGPLYHMWYVGMHSEWGMNIGHATSEDGITWTRDSGNPVLERDPENGWDKDYVYLPRVLYVDSVFHMWYVGANGPESLGYATSTDGSTWTKYEGNPLGNIGESSDWDAGKMGSGGIYHDGEKFHSWYSGSASGSSNYEMGYATSTDGMIWIRESDIPVMEHGVPGAWDNPRTQPSSVVVENGLKHIWYSGGDFSDWQIGYANSEDGFVWERDSLNPVVSTVEEASSGREEFVAFPYVIRDATDGKLKMWYFGSSAGFSGSIFYAEYTNITGTPGQAVGEAGFRIFPNPATNRVSITSAYQGSRILSLSTLNGQVVYQEVYDNYPLELDVASFPRGMYILRLSTGNSFCTKKLILH